MYLIQSYSTSLTLFLYSPPASTTLLSHPSHGVQVITSLKVHKQSLFCRLCLLRWWSQVSQESEPTSESVFLSQISRFLLSIHDCSHNSCQYVEHDTLGGGHSILLSLAFCLYHNFTIRMGLLPKIIDVKSSEGRWIYFHTLVNHLDSESFEESPQDGFSR